MATDTVLRWVKESVAALIGLAIVICLVAMIWRAFDFLEPDHADPSFQRVKDLLLFINPLVGVMIGYYFNRVSTEARAENAERTARGATMTAQRAESARDEAQARAQINKAEADEARSVLGDIIPAAQTVLSQTPPPPPPAALAGGAGGGNAAPADALTEARMNLQAALDRARAVVGRSGQEA